eukprot:6623340-Prymnesium_polylepis.1
MRVHPSANDTYTVAPCVASKKVSRVSCAGRVQAAGRRCRQGVCAGRVRDRIGMSTSDRRVHNSDKSVWYFVAQLRLPTMLISVHLILHQSST